VEVLSLPGSRVVLLVVEDFELRCEVLERRIYLAELVDLG
jgi:hypothetical protein